MAKRFFIWKDKNCNGINPEWIEITYPEFKKIKDANKTASNEEQRWFCNIPGIEEDDDYLIMECTYEDYKKSDVSKITRRRKRESTDMFYANYDLVSLDYTYIDDSGEEYTLHDIVADEKINIEETAFIHLETSLLYEAISLLEKDDSNFILFWLKSKATGLSDEDISALLKITRDKLRWNYKRICKDLKKIIENLK